MEIIRSGLVRAEDFVTGQFPLERAEEAFAASTSGEHVKVLLHP
jgi:threonine dehydrogenase-like Zn-dependent dehydrogenase